MDHSYIDGKVIIPRISPTRLEELSNRFKPLFQVIKKKYHNDVLVESKSKIHAIEVPDLSNVAFTWDPKLKYKVKFKPIMEVHTIHGCGYHAFVKPSISEVLANIQDNTKLLESKANAFYIDMEHVEIFKSGEGHRLKTIFGKI